MRIVENVPLDTSIIGELLGSNKDDLYLVWPKASFPFDHNQWKEALTKDSKDISLLFYEDTELVGQGALVKTQNDDEFALSFLYIIPELRSKGYGEKMINMLESYAKEKYLAKQLCLVVRTYNPRGHRCYSKCGFAEYDREDTLIRMRKSILY